MVFDVARPMEDHLALVEDLRNLLDRRGLDVLVQGCRCGPGRTLAWQSESRCAGDFQKPMSWVSSS